MTILVTILTSLYDKSYFGRDGDKWFRSGLLGFSLHDSLSHYYYHPSEVTPLPSFLVSYSSYLFNLNNFWVPCKKGMTNKYGYTGSISFTWTWCYDLSFDILIFWCWTWSIWWYDGMIMMLWLQVYAMIRWYDHDAMTTKKSSRSEAETKRDNLVQSFIISSE
jgi:hypothetical protein